MNETPESEIIFTINGQQFTVTSNVPPTTRLLEYIREWAQLTGTKRLCHEGGCGLCTVVATKYDFETESVKTFSLQSCQVLVYSCSGWEITTIEHLGNKFDGYHPIQNALVGYYGTQCGYCTPGFVMTMYGQMASSQNLTTEKIEKSLDGNLCRCTGYRPILEAFKSFAVDAPRNLVKRLTDIEDLKKCSKSGIACIGTCKQESESTCAKIAPHPIELMVGNTTWHSPTKIQSLIKVVQKNKGKKIRLVVGNTGQGVYKFDGPYDVYIDTNGIKELHSVNMKVPLTIGANVTLARCIEIFQEASKTFPQYLQLKRIAKHWSVVANVGIRNLGSWVGNLSLKHQHKEFPSDIFLTLLALGVTVVYYDIILDKEENISLGEFLSKDLSGRFIISMSIPSQAKYEIRTYKITKRAVNSHAYVNAAFRFHLDSSLRIMEKPVILFGGIDPHFVHAEQTESFLEHQSLLDPNIAKRAAKVLDNEVVPDNQPQDASPLYRKSLTKSLLYKAILDIVGQQASARYRSGGSILKRPVTSSVQTFDKNKDSWPIGEPMPKLESYWQVSGEAEYIDDIPLQHGELHGAFIQTNIACATISSIDYSEALKLPGVVTFIGEQDIPGRNSFLSADFYSVCEPLFTSKYSKYAGQAVGLIIAKRRDIALEAVKLVKIEYSNHQKPILNIKEALKTRHKKQDPILLDNRTCKKEKTSKNVIEGELQLGSQYHFYTESMSAIVVPKEEGYDVWASTQFTNETQSAVAEVLNVEANRLNFTVRRLGGAFGGKISRGNVAACAAAVAAHKTRKPIRIVLPLDVNMTLVGWREPYYSRYKVGFSDEGLLEKVEVNYIADVGVAENDTSIDTVHLIPGVYYADLWCLTPSFVHTDTAANTWCRTPGFVEALATMENIIEHVATYLNQDPSHVREINFTTDTKKNYSGVSPRGENTTATTIFPQLKKQAHFDKRKTLIDAFNKENRWRKKGISILPLLYVIAYAQEKFQVQVAIYALDGSVAISHGGIEMGQGINTKVAQIAAKILDISVDLVKVKATNNFVGANSSMSAGSLGTDLCAYGTKICCEKLKTRINIVAEKMRKQNHKEPDWIPLIKKCLEDDVDLSERYWTATSEHPKGYDIFGSACVEVEIDILTGQFMINRADIIEDCGKSLSPFIDVGQVEGSMVMAFGLFTTEMVKLDQETGRKLTNNTWEYKIPSALDIPVDFRVSLLQNGDNPFGVVRSKATGEPAVCLGYCLVTALRHAIKSARADAGLTDWFDMDTPLTVEHIHQLCSVQCTDFNIRDSLDL